MLSLGIQDARIRSREQNEHSGSEEDGDDGTQTLGNPLLYWRRPEKETHAEVGRQVGRLVGAHVGESTTQQVQLLRVCDAPALALGCAAEDDLRSLGGGSERGDVWNM